ncbi:hypothetical protein, partial [Klebsiella michiganensis]|uniref:hypothetical protein n=1 Tax=Klebsiella michiganensis TaxID=1134687 RepID=UPI00301B7660
MLRICPGYGFATVCDPVARVRRVKRRLRVFASFPGGDASHLSGLRVRHHLRSDSPGKAFTPRPGKAT